MTGKPSLLNPRQPLRCTARGGRTLSMLQPLQLRRIAEISLPYVLIRSSIIMLLTDSLGAAVSEALTPPAQPIFPSSVCFTLPVLRGVATTQGADAPSK